MRLVRLRKRTWIFILEGGVVCLLFAIFWNGPGTGPVSNGHHLSWWVEMLGEPNVDRMEAVAAIQQTGTNAIPYLMKWIQNESQPWSQKHPALFSILKACHMDGLVTSRSVFRINGAENGLIALRADIPPATLEELVRLMKTVTAPQTATRAAMVLMRLGPNASAAAPALTVLLDDPNPSVRQSATNILQSITLTYSPQSPRH
jgi:HEAT repeat protein